MMASSHTCYKLVHSISVAWVALMEAIFSPLNLKPDDQFLPYNLPEIFIKSKYDLTGIIIDWTEFKFQQPSDYD